MAPRRLLIMLWDMKEYPEPHPALACIFCSVPRLLLSHVSTKGKTSFGSMRQWEAGAFDHLVTSLCLNMWFCLQTSKWEKIS